MRIRSIRPEFWSSEDVAAMDWPTRLIFIGLWSYVDDNGVGRDIERLIVTSLFPLDDDLTEASLNVHRALKYLNTRGHITRYEVENKPYLHVTNWTKHQRINRPSEGRYPLPTTANAEIHEPLTEDSLSTHADAPLGEGEKGRRGEVNTLTGEADEDSPTPIDEYDFPGFRDFWEIYPRKVDKKPALKSYRAAVKRADREVIHASVTEYAEYVANTPPDKIKHAATWLNNDCWENDYTTQTATDDTNDYVDGTYSPGWFSR